MPEWLPDQDAAGSRHEPMPEAPHEDREATPQEGRAFGPAVWWCGRPPFRRMQAPARAGLRRNRPVMDPSPHVATPTVSAMRAWRVPSGCGGPSVVSSAV